MTVSRLFDCLRKNVIDSPVNDMLAAKINGQWKKYSTQEVFDLVNGLSAGLLKIGIGYNDGSAEGRDKVAVIAKNRPEWVILDHAVQQSGGILIPIYPNIGSNELEFILRDARVKVVFVNDAMLYEKVSAIASNLPELEKIYSFDEVQQCNYWEELLTYENLQLNEAVKSISARIGLNDLVTIIYTSGTTGTPKGVMLSHNNILSNVIASTPAFPKGNGLRALSFLPLNHIFERMITFLYLYNNTSIYYAESMDQIAENLREVKPQVFSTVPRLLEKVYEKIMAKGRELKGIKRWLFFRAHKIALAYEIERKHNFWYQLQLSIANKLIFNKWREALGNNIICIVSGGAPCQVRLIRIFTAAKIPILEGYGLTETSPVISVNRMELSMRKFGTVGPIIDDVQVKIADDGEILCKGQNVMVGYFKNTALTEECLIDGWYKTGDIGELIEGKFLKITDRKKEIFKTSGGKYVAPMFIENKFKECRFVENIMVTGAGKKFVAALIIPSATNLMEWAKEKGINTSDYEQLIKIAAVVQFFDSLVEEINKNFNHVEQIKRFVLLAKEWTVETGELTPKLSLRRKIIEEKYKEAIDRIYS